MDAALQQRRQGDLALEELWFVHVGNPGLPLTIAAGEAAGDGPQALDSEVRGLIIVTQTCDVVRACVDRPYVAVAPLVQIGEANLQQVNQGRRPAYATLPSLEAGRLVADLDRVMTVEKSIVARWTRTAGYTDDATVERPRSRQETSLVEKHGKDSIEGRGLRALRAIRVRAVPSWDATDLEVFLWFVREGDEASARVQAGRTS